VTESLACWVDAPASDVLGAFGQRDALRGRRVRWERSGEGGTGVAEGVDEVGNLLVRERRGEVLALGSGEVQLAIEPQS
jgi:biotin-(acetyl-CoA carboxylase) ligase